MTEYLSRSREEGQEECNKQGFETTAFERLAPRLKKYFPRLKIIILADAMLATQSVMGTINDNGWEYIIRLPKKKLTDFAKIINKKRDSATALPNQHYFRKRKQLFCWENHITYGYEWQLDVNLIACYEEYDTVNIKTGDIEKCFVE